MGKRVVYITLIIILMSAFASTTALAFYAGRKKTGMFPAPRMISPITEEVDLSPKEALLFRWSPYRGGASALIYFDFRIYKGYEAIESALVYKEKLTARKSNIEISADTFDSGDIYTWSIRYKNKDGTYSPKNFHSFKVIK